MFDILPFPNITATTVEEQVAQINNYLIQLKEALEFALADISVDNLSTDLLATLSSIDSNIKSVKEEQDNQLQQVAGKTLTVYDVINSEAFKTCLPKKYLVSVVEEEDAETGAKTYTFTDSDGETVVIKLG